MKAGRSAGNETRLDVVPGSQVPEQAAGAANITFVRVLLSAGVPAVKIVLVDSKVILHPGARRPRGRQRATRTSGSTPSRQTPSNEPAGWPRRSPGTGTIRKDSLSAIDEDAIAFIMADPIPKIWPWEAKEAGVRIVGTGRSDFANQINNSIGFLRSSTGPSTSSPRRLPTRWRSPPPTPSPRRPRARD